MMLRHLNQDLDLTSLELLAEVAEDYGLRLDPSEGVQEDGPIQPAHSSVVSSKLASYISKSDIAATDDSAKYRLAVDSTGQYGMYSHDINNINSINKCDI